VKYGFTRSFARVEIAVGILVIIAGAGLAITAFYLVPQDPGWARLAVSPAGRYEFLARIAGALILFGASALVGTVFIVSGQLVLVFLDMRRRLERIDRRLRDWKSSEPAAQSPLSERLRPRR
jgi:hypothetical protein